MTTYTVYNASNLPVLTTQSWTSAVYRMSYLRQHGGCSLQVNGVEATADGIEQVMLDTAPRGRSAYEGNFRQPTDAELARLVS